MSIVFDIDELRACILDFVYPRFTTVGMHFQVVKGDRVERLKSRVFKINNIRIDEEFGVVIVSENRLRHRGDLHHTITYFYPECGDGLRVVANHTWSRG